MLQNDSIDHLIEYMKSRQKAAGLTVRQYAELANVTENTINNIYYKKVDSVKIDIAARLVHAVGGSLDEAFGIGASADSSFSNQQNITSIQIQQPAVSSQYDANAFVEGMKAVHKREMEALQAAHDRETQALIDAHRAESQARDEHLADIRKGRTMWCVMACVLTAVICGWLIWDLTHPNAGLIRYAQSLGIIGRFG